MAGWMLRVHDARTGEWIEDLPESVGPQWSTGITGNQSSTENFFIGRRSPLRNRVEQVFAGNRHLMVRTWDDTHVAYAQKIDDWDYDLDAKQVKVSAVELRGEAGWRLIGGVGTSKTATFTITDKSASGAVRAALQQMMNWGPAWEFPIDLPADGNGPFSGRWEFWRKQRMSDIIGQIEKFFGVEMYLRPYITGSGVLRFETLVQSRVQFDPVKFNLQAPKTPLTGVRYGKDYTRQLTGLLGVGNGTGQDQATAWAGQDEHPIIIRDTQESIPDLKGVALQNATTNRFNARRQPTTRISVEAFTFSDNFPLSLTAPGRQWELESNGDPVIPDGINATRVITRSGSNSQQVKVEVQGGTE